MSQEAIYMSEESIYLIIGVVSLILFGVQTLMTFLGGDGHDADGSLDHGHIDHGDGHHDGDGDHDDHHGLSFLRFFTLRNLIAFAMGYSWVGFASLKSGFPSVLTVLLGIGAGVLFVWMIYKLMRILNRLESDGTADLNEALGQVGEVYLEIEENSPGKILVLLRGAKRELPAVNMHPGRLEKGSAVRILDYDGNYFSVERA